MDDGRGAVEPAEEKSDAAVGRGEGEEGRDDEILSSSRRLFTTACLLTLSLPAYRILKLSLIVKNNSR